MAYTDIDNPELYFQAKNYTGNASTNAITLDGSENMQPDMVWLKSRSFSQNHELYDSVRGATKRLYPNGTYVEDTNSTGVTAFNSDGFTLGSSNAINKSGETFASWNWLAGGSASSNSSGDITSSVSANQTAGFSIVSYTGNDVNGETIGHGLSKAPELVIIKAREGSYTSQGWGVIGSVLSSTTALKLDSTAATVSAAGVTTNTLPTATVFTVADNYNHSGSGHIAYCFHSVDGFSNCTSYIGNNNADGTFVYLGFRPAWILLKNSTDSNTSWVLFDNKRSTVNPVDDSLSPDTGYAEEEDYDVDFLSNAAEDLVEDPDGEFFLKIVEAGDGNRHPRRDLRHRVQSDGRHSLRPARSEGPP